MTSPIEPQNEPPTSTEEEPEIVVIEINSDLDD